MTRDLVSQIRSIDFILIEMGSHQKVLIRAGTGSSLSFITAWILGLTIFLKIMKPLRNGSELYTQENMLPGPGCSSLWAKECTAGYKFRLNGWRTLELPNHPLSQSRRLRRYCKQLHTLLFLTIPKGSTCKGHRTVGEHLMNVVWTFTGHTFLTDQNSQSRM